MTYYDLQKEAKELIDFHTQYFQELTERMDKICREIKKRISQNNLNDAEKLFFNSLRALWFLSTKQVAEDNWQKEFKGIKKPLEVVIELTSVENLNSPKISGFLTELFILIFCKELFTKNLTFSHSVNFQGNTKRKGGENLADIFIKDGVGNRLAVQVKTTDVRQEKVEKMIQAVNKVEVPDKFCFVLLIASNSEDYSHYEELKEFVREKTQDRANFYMFLGDYAAGKNFEQFVKKINKFGWLNLN